MNNGQAPLDPRQFAGHTPAAVPPDSASPVTNPTSFVAPSAPPAATAAPFVANSAYFAARTPEPANPEDIKGPADLNSSAFGAMPPAPQFPSAAETSQFPPAVETSQFLSAAEAPQPLSTAEAPRPFPTVEAQQLPPAAQPQFAAQPFPASQIPSVPQVPSTPAASPALPDDAFKITKHGLGRPGLDAISSINNSLGRDKDPASFYDEIEGIKREALRKSYANRRDYLRGDDFDQKALKGKAA